jgi:hypothetical protein
VQQQQARQKLQQQQVVNGHQRPQEPLPVGNGGNELKQISRSKTPSPIGKFTFYMFYITYSA